MYPMYVCGLRPEMNLKAEDGQNINSCGLLQGNTEMTAITLPCYTQARKLEFNNSLIRLHPFMCDAEHNLLCIILDFIYVI